MTPSLRQHVDAAKLLVHNLMASVPLNVRYTGITCVLCGRAWGAHGYRATRYRRADQGAFDFLATVQGCLSGGVCDLNGCPRFVFPWAGQLGVKIERGRVAVNNTKVRVEPAEPAGARARVG